MGKDPCRALGLQPCMAQQNLVTLRGRRTVFPQRGTVSHGGRGIPLTLQSQGHFMAIEPLQGARQGVLAEQRGPKRLRKLRAVLRHQRHWRLPPILHV